MNCSKAQKLISARIDNLLNAGQNRKLASHLDHCAVCRSLLSDMESIVLNAKELDNLTPSEDLWPAIKREVLRGNRRADIRQVNISRYFPLHFRGPVLAFGTLFALLIMIPMLYNNLPHTRSKNSDPVETALFNYRTAEAHYQSAIEALDEVVATRGMNLDPELMSMFKKNLAIIDDSIRICKQSMEKSPDARETNKLLLLCYVKKIELLNEIKDITMQS